MEKLASSRGVVLQSVKDVLMSLVHDDLVHQEKIGSQNYFWSFPAEASNKLKQQAAQHDREVAAIEQELFQLREKVQAVESQQVDHAARSVLMDEVRAAETTLARQQRELSILQQNDPKKLESIQEATQIALEAGNRWVDNVWALQAWTRKKFVGMEANLNKFYKDQGIKDDFDYLTLT